MGLLNKLSLKSHSSKAAPEQPPASAPAALPARAPFSLADALLPQEPEQRLKLYESLDNASLAQLRLSCKAIAHETRPLLLKRKWPEIAAAKPPEMDTAELIKQVRTFDALEASWPKEPWTWHEHGDDRKLQYVYDVPQASAAQAPKLLKMTQSRLREAPHEMRFHLAAMTLHATLEDWGPAGEEAAHLLTMQRDEYIDARGGRLAIQPIDHHTYLSPAAFELSDQAGQHHHWSRQASYLLQAFDFLMAGHKAHPEPLTTPQALSRLIDKCQFNIHRLAAHTAIAIRFSKSAAPRSQHIAYQHAQSAHALRDMFQGPEIPLTQVVLNRLSEIQLLRPR